MQGPAQAYICMHAASRLKLERLMLLKHAVDTCYQHASCNTEASPYLFVMEIMHAHARVCTSICKAVCVCADMCVCMHVFARVST